MICACAGRGGALIMPKILPTDEPSLWLESRSLAQARRGRGNGPEPGPRDTERDSASPRADARVQLI